MENLELQADYGDGLGFGTETGFENHDARQPVSDSLPVMAYISDSRVLVLGNCLKFNKVLVLPLLPCARNECVCANYLHYFSSLDKPKKTNVL